MPVDIMLSTLTEKGAETVKSNPKRIMEVDSELSAMGVKVKEQYAVLGPYDFVNIVEAPDDVTVARASLELGSRGSVRIQTLRALPIADFVEAMS